MENDDPKDEQQPPGFPSAPRWNDLGFPVLRNENVGSTGLFNAAGADNMPIPSTMMPLSSFTFGGMQAAPQSYNEGSSSTSSRSMTDVSHSQTSQDAKSADESFRRREDKRPMEIGLFSNSPGWEGDILAHHSFHSLNNPVAPDNVINPASFVDLTNSPYVVWNDNSASRSWTVEQGGEVNSGNLHMPQPVRSFANSGTQTLSLLRSLGGEELGISNNLRTNVVRSHSSRRLDGSFLRLGIDVPSEDLSRCSVSGIDIGSNNNQTVDLALASTSNNQSARSSDLIRANSSNSQSARSSLNPSISTAGGFPGFQNDGDGLMGGVSTTVSPGSSQVAGHNSTLIRVYNFEDLMSPCSSGRISHSDAQRLQQDGRHHISAPSNRIAPRTVRSQDAGFASGASVYDFLGYSTTSLIPGSSQIGVRDSRWSSPTSDSSRRTSGSSMFLALNIGESCSSRQHQFGEPSTSNDGGAMQVYERGQQIPIMNVNTISQAGSVLDGPSLKRGSLESSQDTLQSQRRRIGTPLSIQDLPEIAAPTGLEDSAVSLLHQANRTSLQPLHQTAPTHYFRPQIASSIPPQSGASMLPPQSQYIPFPQQRWIAPPSLPRPLPAQLLLPPQPLPAQPFQLHSQLVPVVPFNPGPAVTHAPQPQNAPNFLPQPWSTAPPEHWHLQHILPQTQTAQRRRRPPLIPLSQTARRRRRPPLIRGPAPVEYPHVLPQYQPAPRRGRPPLSRATTSRQRHPPHSEVLRIKWEGPDIKLQPLGYRCFLCGRDLSFTEEGPAYLSIRAPPVSVLPCGHTFHEICLQHITPRADAASPPCVACDPRNKD